MIHSGALYAKLHGNIVRDCAEAGELFASTFPAALVARGAYYYAHKQCVEHHAVMWDRHGVRYRWAHRDEVDAVHYTGASEASPAPGVVEAYRRDPLVHHGAVPARTAAQRSPSMSSQLSATPAPWSG